MKSCLGKVATYVNGYAFKPSDWGTQGLPIIRIQDLTGTAYQTNCYDGKYDSKYEIHKGDILISWSASLGIYKWNGPKAILNQHIFKVLLNTDIVDPGFFIHQTRNILHQASNQAHGATMKHLTKPVFERLPFSLPSLLEQKRIAERLDKVQELIALQKEQLTKLDDLIKSRFIDLFGDPITNSKKFKIDTLNNICDVRDGTHDSPEYVLKGYPLITSKNIVNGNISLEEVNFITKLDFDNINKRSKVDVGDILLPMIGTIGNPALVKQEPNYAIKNMALIKFLPQSRCSNLYILYLLRSSFLDNIIKNQQRGGTQKFLALKTIRGLQIPIPLMSLQIQFADFVTKIEAQKGLLTTRLSHLETLYKSLMQEYFG